jgi:hypothetical protein
VGTEITDLTIKDDLYGKVEVMEVDPSDERQLGTTE